MGSSNRGRILYRGEKTIDALYTIGCGVVLGLLVSFGSDIKTIPVIVTKIDDINNRLVKIEDRISDRNFTANPRNGTTGAHGGWSERLDSSNNTTKSAKLELAF